MPVEHIMGGDDVLTPPPADANSSDATGIKLQLAQHLGNLGENPSRVGSGIGWSTGPKVHIMLFECRVVC